METHVWHAKRFHMTGESHGRWGYRLALYPNDKGARAAYRAVANKCLMTDMSYMGCVELRGKREDLEEGLGKIALAGADLGCKADQETHFWLRDQDQEVIGRASLVWKSCQSVAWLWIHPAYFQQGFQALQQAFDLRLEEPAQVDPGPEAKKPRMADKINEAKMANRNVPFDLRVPKFVSGTKAVSAFDLRDTLNRFRLVGPLAPTLLRQTLIPAEFVGFQENTSEEDGGAQFWWQSHYDERPLQETALQLENTKPRSVNYVVARDPRYILPPKRGCVEQEILQDGGEEVKKTVEGTRELSAIWSSEVRDAVTTSKIPDATVNKRRSQRLVPGTAEPEDAEEAKVPTMLIHQARTRSHT